MENSATKSINAVVVTYNRLPLLKECVDAVKSQTYPINKIFVIDNKSTDGTAEYLRGQSAADDRLVIVSLAENEGGAGGFFEGIKDAVLDGCDWVWTMDDDTIPTPTALEELVKVASITDNVGFACSRVVWTDGMLHKMNIPSFHRWGKGAELPINYYTYAADALLISSASFVSLLVNSQVVRKVGLPIKEFFIWCDDYEFTMRIYNAGYTCFYADKSIALHKTKDNYFSDISTASVDVAWKFYYGLRNLNYMKRAKKKNAVSYFFHILNDYRRNLRHIRHRCAEDRAVFGKILKRVVRDSFKFNPKIRYIQDFEAK